MVGTSERVGAVVSVRSMGGLSVFDPKGPIDAARAGAFASTLKDARHVADTLIQLGFDITHFHPMAISFSGAPVAFDNVFGVKLHKSAKPGGRGRSIDVFTPDKDDAPALLDLPRAFGGRAEGVAVACPPRLIDDAGLPVREIDDDDRPRRCLPDELAMSIWGDGLATLGATGDGVVVAMIGTGCYRHRFFAERRYRLLPTLLGPGRTGSLHDEHGHSTGEAACLFAAAPNLRLRPIKGLLDPVGDMLMTIDSHPRPDLIVNSWGYDVDQTSWDRLKADDPNLHNYLRLLEATIAQATAQGIAVAAAAPQHWQSFPTSHPDVIATAATGGRLTLAEEQTAKVSGLYPGRQVPDFWSSAEIGGALGEGFMQPCQPTSTLGRTGEAGAADEGWARCDLGQASFPLAAGMIAVLLERHPSLPPLAIKTLMTQAVTELALSKQIINDSALPTDTSIELGVSAPAVDNHVAA